MKAISQIAFASLLFSLMIFAPASALASTSESAHAHSVTYHDRSPRVHERGAHPHHG